MIMVLQGILIILKNFLIEDIVDVAGNVRTEMPRNQNSPLLVKDVQGRNPTHYLNQKSDYKKSNQFTKKLKNNQLPKFQLIQYFLSFQQRKRDKYMMHMQENMHPFNSTFMKKLEVHFSQFPLHSRKILSVFMHQAITELGQKELQRLIPQFQILFFQKLQNPNKITSLKDINHRTLILDLIKQESIRSYNYSYFNSAKITDKHLKYLKEIGPYLFNEAVLIASNMNRVKKFYARIMTEKRLYSVEDDAINGEISEQASFDLTIFNLLKICDVKKRSINSNLRKLELILERNKYRVKIIKELGKIVRDSWKQEKENKRKREKTKKAVQTQERSAQQKKSDQDQENLFAPRVQIDEKQQIIPQFQLELNQSKVLLRELKKKEQMFEIKLVQRKSWPENQSLWEKQLKSMNEFEEEFMM